MNKIYIKETIPSTLTICNINFYWIRYSDNLYIRVTDQQLISNKGAQFYN